MDWKYSSHWNANGDDVVIAHGEDLGDGIVEVVIEGGTGIRQEVDLHGPGAYLVEGLLHERQVAGRSGGQEEVIGDLVSAGVCRHQRIIVPLHLYESMHGKL